MPVWALHIFLYLGIGVDTATLISGCILIFMWSLVFIIAMAENPYSERDSIVRDIASWCHKTFLFLIPSFNNKTDILLQIKSAFVGVVRPAPYAQECGRSLSHLCIQA